MIQLIPQEYRQEQQHSVNRRAVLPKLVRPWSVPMCGSHNSAFSKHLPSNQGDKNSNISNLNKRGVDCVGQTWMSQITRLFHSQFANICATAGDSPIRHMGSSGSSGPNYGKSHGYPHCMWKKTWKNESNWNHHPHPPVTSWDVMGIPTSAATFGSRDPKSHQPHVACVLRWWADTSPKERAGDEAPAWECYAYRAI